MYIVIVISILTTTCKLTYLRLSLFSKFECDPHDIFSMEPLNLSYVAFSDFSSTSVVHASRKCVAIVM